MFLEMSFNTISMKMKLNFINFATYHSILITVFNDFFLFYSDHKESYLTRYNRCPSHIPHKIENICYITRTKSELIKNM